VEFPIDERPVAFGRENFESFYERNYPRMVGLAFALSGNRWGAEDIAQEAFLVAHRSWDRIRDYEDPAVWVRRVVANMSVSFFRRRMLELRTLARLNSRRPPLPELSTDDGEFWSAVRSLPRRQAQTIALHYLEDLPVAEVASILGCAEGTVKASLHSGRRALAQRLRYQDEEEA
jgi:RNA polymerase sigma-70 factor, ECF subfamily